MKLFNGVGSMKNFVIMIIMLIVGLVLPSANAQTSTPTLGADSVYTIVEGTESDYTFTTTDGETVNYYKVLLNTDNMSTSSSIQWSELPDSTNSNLMLSLPHNGDTSNPEVKYFAYTYTMPSGYTETNERVEDPTAEQVNNKLFKGASYTASSEYVSGGAINSYCGTWRDIVADFIGNYVQGSSVAGGAVYVNSFWDGINITGDFINNYARAISYSAHGGALYVESASGVNVTGDFIGNYAFTTSSGAYGGAIYNYALTIIETITGDFIGNYTFSTNSGAYGGAIHNSRNASIGSITGDFVDNYVQGGYTFGGAIYNIGTIEAIIGDFIDNNAFATGTGAHGGAIYNSGTITSINGDFVNNHINGVASNAGGAIDNDGNIAFITGDFTGNYITANVNANGGAIVNSGTIGTISGSFIDNYVKVNSSGAIGGAIWTKNDLSFVADNRTNTFSGNYIQVGNGEKQYEAIYVDSADATLTFNATNGGKFVMNDYTNGKTGYNVKLTGDGSGTFELNNQLKGADVITENITVDLANDKLDNYTFNTLTSSANTKYELDVDFANKTSDTITTASASSGVVTVIGLNILNDLFQLTGDYKIKVLNTQNSDLQLALSDEIQRQLATYGETYVGKTIVSTTAEAIKQATNWDDTYAIMGQYIKLYGTMGLATTTTTNDSIGVSVSRTELGDVEQAGTVTDILAYVNQNDGGYETREFNFSGADNVYTVKENLGNTVGKLLINGVADPDSKSTIDFERKTGFMVNNSNANLIVNNVEMKNAKGQAVKITNGGKSTINNVDFTNNLNSTSRGNLRGGALHVNNSEVTSISGNFENNKADSESGDSLGGAISNDNYGKILEIKNTVFKNNAAEGTGWVEGGALWNSNMSTIGDINADFYYNKVVSTGGEANGGALYNNYFSSIGDIVANFVGNSAEGPLAQGGAIMNNASSTIKSITGNFVNNFVKGTSKAQGGAIFNATTLKALNANFTGNYAERTGGGDAYGGAIYNAGTITTLSGNFENNYVKSTGTTQGGAIFTKDANIGDITANFFANYAEGSGYVEGGAIWMLGGKIANITGDFINNFLKANGNGHVQGGAIYNNGGEIGVISGKFVGNSVKTPNGDAIGGAIFNNGATIKEIKNSYFVNNKVEGTRWVEGGALWSSKYSTLGDVEADFVENAAISTGNTAQGGAVYLNEGTIGAKDENNNVVGGLINSSFIGNYAESAIGLAKGGALFTRINVNLFADGKDVQIRDNYTMSNGVKDDNAIYVDNSGATLTFNIKNNGSILLKDNIDGVAGYKFNVTGDDTGVFYLQNDIRNANVSMGGITLSTINNMVYNNHFNNFTLTDTINMVVDVDLANGTMDRVSADTYGSHNGNLNVIGMNLLSDMVDGVNSMNIVFADAGLKGAVTFGAGELPHNDFQTTLYTPIYKYNVAYDNRDDAGYFMFAKGDKIILPNGGIGSTGNASDAFNPAVLAGSTSASVGAVGTMNQAVNHSFNSVDAYMNIPYMERMAMKRRNHYALAGVPDEVRQLGRYSPLYLPGDEEESVWVKPYTTFESIPLKNGPRVSNISYGTLVGFDSQMKSLRYGWDRVISGYVGYTGASQRYSGVDSVQNGGLLGGTVTLYRGNFFNATTLNVGASVAQNETMYGKDDYTMLMSGIANKTGYNLEFKDGKLILQPSMLVGYTFVNTFDYTNAAGVKIDNKPLHTIQLSPSVKLIGNLKGGWQPYASVGMVWNLMGELDTTANGVKLPEMKVKPYVQYGVGLQKRIKDHFMAYGQAMLHNGGRNGISLTAGFRWALGHKDKCDYENKEIKSDKKAVKVKKDKKAEIKTERKEIKKTEIKKTEIKVKKLVKKDTNFFKISSKTVK